MDWPTFFGWAQLLVSAILVPVVGLGVAWVRKTSEALVDLRLEIVALQGQLSERTKALDECRARDREDHAKLFGKLDRHAQAVATIAARSGAPIGDLG